MRVNRREYMPRQPSLPRVHRTRYRETLMGSNRHGRHHNNPSEQDAQLSRARPSKITTQTPFEPPWDPRRLSTLE